MKRNLISLLGLVVAAGATWIALTTLAPPSWIATWAPCPRNWAWADSWRPRASPLDAVRFTIGDDGHGKICYGRPSRRGRKMLGGSRIPFGQLWRTGANEPTTLHVDAPVRFGSLDLIPGSYSIYTVPGPASWEIVVNRATRQWGLESQYTSAVQALEVGRFRAPVEVLDTPVETLTIRTVPTSEDAIDVLIEWETTRVRIPLESVFAGIEDTPP
jgi:hypothetical protein